MPRRVYMYRKGEAKIFASPEDVPAGEGWQDTPVADTADEPVADEAAEKPKQRRKKFDPEATAE